MHHSRASRAHSPVVAILLFLSPVVSALDLETGVGLGMSHTNNAALTSTDEQDDWIAEASVGATLFENTGSVG